MTDTAPARATATRTDPATATAAQQPPLAPGPPPPTPDRSPPWRRVGRVLLGVGVLMLALVVWAVAQLLISPSADNGPGDTGRDGYAALAALVRDEGIDVVETDSYGDLRERDLGRTTVVVTRTRTLERPSWQALLDLRPARVVLVAPNAATLERLGIPATAEHSTQPSGAVEPGCSDPAAERAGAITVPVGVDAYSTAGPADAACYPVGSAGHLHLALRVDGVPVVLTPPVGTNGLLAHQGNAALSMQAVGAEPALVWWFPQLNDPTVPGTEGDDGGSRGNRLPYPSLLPPGWIHAVALAFLAVVVVAIWRGRRLGPVMVEDLPSVVPASETVEGHGRLYARLSARDTASRHLRSAATRRLARLVGHSDDPEMLARALADRTGWSYGEVRHLVDGPPPPNDEQLVILKRKLDALEQEARRP